MIKCWICTKTFWQNSARKQVWNQWLHIFKVKWISCMLCESNYKHYYECRKANFFFFFNFQLYYLGMKSKEEKLYVFPSWHHLWVTEFFKLNFWGKKSSSCRKYFSSELLYQMDFSAYVCALTHTCTYLFTNDIQFFPPRVLFQIKQQQRRKNIRICSNKSTSAKNARTQPSLER